MAMSRTAAPEGQDANAEREAFDRVLAPHFPELLQAAQREVRHRLTLGQFAPDDPTPEQLLDMALQRAWQEPRICPPHSASKRGRWPRFSAREKCWLRGRMSAAVRRPSSSPRGSNPTRSTRKTTKTFGNHTSWTIFSGTVDRPWEDAASDDELVGLLDPREREVLLMREVHGMALPELASAVGIPLTEAERLLASARNRLRAVGKAAH